MYAGVPLRNSAKTLFEHCELSVEKHGGDLPRLNSCRIHKHDGCAATLPKTMRFTCDVDKKPNGFGIRGFAQNILGQRFAVSANRFLGITYGEKADIDGAAPSRIREESLVCAGRRLIDFPLPHPVLHPAPGVVETAIEDQKIGAPIVHRVEHEPQLVDARPNVILGAGTRNVSHDFGTFLRALHLKIETPEELMKDIDEGSLSCVRRAVKLKDHLTQERPPSAISLIRSSGVS